MTSGLQKFILERSTHCFFAGILTAGIPYCLIWLNNLFPLYSFSSSSLTGRLLFYVLFSVLMYLYILFQAKEREIAVRAAFLGTVTGVGLVALFTFSPSYKALGLYIVLLGWFHFSEYCFIKMYNPRKAKIDSFMLCHSRQYIGALVISLLEYLGWCYFFPEYEGYILLWGLLGLLCCIVGEIVRKSAMVIAGPNFDHIVQSNLDTEHHLITHGIYKYIQHPSYTGWYIFTIGTQMVLSNLFCLIGFGYVMIRFFEERVEGEEKALETRHKEKYREYSKKTPKFVPNFTQLWRRT